MFNPQEKPKIGIPKTLFYYAYYPLCFKFFTELGAEVIASEKTNKTTIEAGLNTSSNELCIPLKVLYGHVLYLKDKVDYIFLPYVISSIKGTYYCPKIIGSPDIIKANIPNVNLLSFDVDMDNLYKSIFSSLAEVATKLSLNPIKIYTAFMDAVAYQKKFDRYIAKGLLFDEAMSIIDSDDGKKQAIQILKADQDRLVTIAVIGHTYIINDSYISFNLIKKLKERNIRVMTSDKLTEAEINASIKNIGTPHWSLGSRVLGSSIYYSKDKKVDGIIYVTPFGCSSDALIKEYMDANIHDKKPVLTLTVDEHSSDAGMITRIEAFMDMIERRRNEENDNKTKHHANNDSKHHAVNDNNLVQELDIDELLNESSEGDL
jgi:predicted nucleotide-binding protein (sugar kinase/HSP70/actin superfamily)